MTEAAVTLWPVAASDYASQVDVLFIALIAVTLMVAGPALFFIVFFMIKYRADRQADRTHPPTRSVALEVGWTTIPFLLTLGIFLWAARLFYVHAGMPSEGLDISVVAKQWMFQFQHPGGQRELDELHVPAGQVVRLTMISQDVIHSLFIPVLRIKQDVLPGRTTGLWFKADRIGEYRIDCAEFCGTYHSKMGRRIVVMPPAAYQAWLGQAETDRGLAAEGARLFRSLGCSGCHVSRTGPVVGPPLDGLYGSPVPLADGGSVIADEAYIRDSILLPSKQIVAGYPDDMPSFAGRLSEADLIRLVAYIQSLAMESFDALCKSQLPDGGAEH